MDGLVFLAANVRIIDTGVAIEFVATDGKVHLLAIEGDCDHIIGFLGEVLNLLGRKCSPCNNVVLQHAGRHRFAHCIRI